MTRGAFENGVHVGRDGWLFWLGRDGEMRDLYGGSWRNRLGVALWARLIRRRRARAAALGTRYLQAVAPDKLSVHDDRLAAPLVDPASGLGARLAAALAGTEAEASWIDLAAPLRAARGPDGPYLRTDTHWTYAGALVATRAVCDAIGIRPAPHLEAPASLPVEEMLHDLGRKLSPARSERRAPQVVPLHARRIDENALAIARKAPGMANAPGHHVGSRIVTRTDDPAAAPLRIVLFGDSYSAEEGYSLAVMLAESVVELHAIWSASIDWDYVARVKPDVVVGEIAERFLRRVPSDRIAIDAYAAGRVARRGRPTPGERILAGLRWLGWPG